MKLAALVSDIKPQP